MLDWEEEIQLVSRIRSDVEHLDRRSVEIEQTLEQEQETHQAAKEAQEILQHISQAVQQRAHQKICEVVSSCLSTVFDNPYEFHIVFERKRGRTEASLRFRRNGLDVDPMSSSGGGMIDVAAFALRVACLMLHRPKLSKVVILDEPFKFVSEQYRDNVRRMLESLSEDLKVQIIQVTHIDELKTGEIIEL